MSDASSVVPRPGQWVEFEFTDGTGYRRFVLREEGDPWHVVGEVEDTGAEILSAWLDGEGWFGLCTSPAMGPR